MEPDLFMWLLRIELRSTLLIHLPSPQFLFLKTLSHIAQAILKIHRVAKDGPELLILPPQC